jgi:osmotically-inducible protein OsmY
MENRNNFGNRQRNSSQDRPRTQDWSNRDYERSTQSDRNYDRSFSDRDYDRGMNDQWNTSSRGNDDFDRESSRTGRDWNSSRTNWNEGRYGLANDYNAIGSGNYSGDRSETGYGNRSSNFGNTGYDGGFGGSRNSGYTGSSSRGSSSNYGNSTYGNSNYGSPNASGTNYGNSSYTGSDSGNSSYGQTYGGVDSGSTYDSKYRSGFASSFGRTGDQTNDRWNREFSSHFGKGPKGYKRSDERIREEASDALTDDHYVDASEIEVRVEAGIVTLSGVVEDRRMKRAAEDCVERVRGVVDVKNELKVKSGNLWDKITGQEVKDSNVSSSASPLSSSSTATSSKGDGKSSTSKSLQ